MQADLAKGITAIKSGNYFTASVEFLEGANGRAQDAQTVLGLMYLGVIDGLMAKESKAAECFNKAAKQGQKEAQYHLGVMYRTGGKSIKKSGFEAFQWFNVTRVVPHVTQQLCTIFLL